MPLPSRRILDSRRDLRHEVVFEFYDGTVSTLPDSRHLVSLEIESPSQGSWSGTLELFDQDGGYLDDLAANLAAVEAVKIRFWEDGQMDVAPYYVGGVVGIEPDFRPEGIGLRIELVSKSVKERVLDLKPRSWKENTNPAQIIRDIALDHGWKVVDKDLVPTVEEASKPIGIALQTTDESDLAFIISRVLPLSLDAEGKHFTFRLSSGFPVIAYFHSVAAPLVAKERRSYTYLRDPNGEVIRFSPKNDMVGSWLMGGGNAQIRGVDSARGAATEETPTVIRGFSGVVVPSDSVYTTPPPADSVASKVAVPGRTAEISAAYAAVMWSRISEASMSAELEVLGTHDVGPGEYVTVNYYRPNGSTHPLAGRFRVLTVKHTFGMDGWVTIFDMIRNGNAYTKDAVKMEVSKVVNVTELPPSDVVSSVTIRQGGNKTRLQP